MQNSELPVFEHSVSMICWALNEEENISEFIERAIALMGCSVADWEIILIDDGSTDRTLEIAQSYHQSNPRFKVVPNDINRNVAFSMCRAISLATKEYLFWQTVDWSYDIADLRNNLEHLRQFDVVQGVRRNPVNARFHLVKPIKLAMQIFHIQYLTRRSDTVSKALISLCNYILLRFLFQVPVSDYQNISFYPTSWIQAQTLESNSSLINPEVLFKAYWAGMSIKEVPINFIARTKGEAKGTKLSSIKRSVLDILYFWFKWVVLGRRHYVRPGQIERLDFQNR